MSMENTKDSFLTIINSVSTIMVNFTALISFLIYLVNNRYIRWNYTYIFPKTTISKAVRKSRVLANTNCVNLVISQLGDMIPVKMWSSSNKYLILKEVNSVLHVEIANLTQQEINQAMVSHDWFERSGDNFILQEFAENKMSNFSYYYVNPTMYHSELYRSMLPLRTLQESEITNLKADPDIIYDKQTDAFIFWSDRVNHNYTEEYLREKYVSLNKGNPNYLNYMFKLGESRQTLLFHYTNTGFEVYRADLQARCTLLPYFMNVIDIEYIYSAQGYVKDRELYDKVVQCKFRVPKDLKERRKPVKKLCDSISNMLNPKSKNPRNLMVYDWRKFFVKEVVDYNEELQPVEVNETSSITSSVVVLPKKFTDSKLQELDVIKGLVYNLSIKTYAVKTRRVTERDRYTCFLNWINCKVKRCLDNQKKCSRNTIAQRRESAKKRNQNKSKRDNVAPRLTRAEKIEQTKLSRARLVMRCMKKFLMSEEELDQILEGKVSYKKRFYKIVKTLQGTRYSKSIKTIQSKTLIHVENFEIGDSKQIYLKGDCLRELVSSRIKKILVSKKLNKRAVKKVMHASDACKVTIEYQYENDLLDRLKPFLR